MGIDHAWPSTPTPTPTRPTCREADLVVRLPGDAPADTYLALAP